MSLPIETITATTTAMPKRRSSNAVIMAVTTATKIITARPAPVIINDSCAGELPYGPHTRHNQTAMRVPAMAMPNTLSRR